VLDRVAGLGRRPVGDSERDLLPTGADGSRQALINWVAAGCGQHLCIPSTSTSFEYRSPPSENSAASPPFGHFGVAAEWTRTYPATAKGVPAAESLSVQTAAALVASFVDPALGKSSNRQRGTRMLWPGFPTRAAR
jgi:hypothetical protein